MNIYMKKLKTTGFCLLHFYFYCLQRDSRIRIFWKKVKLIEWCHCNTWGKCTFSSNEKGLLKLASLVKKVVWEVQYYTFSDHSQTNAHPTNVFEIVLNIFYLWLCWIYFQVFIICHWQLMNSWKIWQRPNLTSNMLFTYEK